MFSGKNNGPNRNWFLFIGEENQVVTTPPTHLTSWPAAGSAAYFDSERLEGKLSSS